jgi:nicotinate-nucleotide adenylyltransferase
VDRSDPIARLRSHRGLRLGIMGGAFDPIHVAHLVTAQEALLQFHMDEVMFLPSGRPPHKKQHVASAEFRYLMVAVATAPHAKFSVSRLEIDRPGVGYTVDTLEYLTGNLTPDTQLFFITGADAVLDILTWKDPSRVLELCTFVAATRPGFDLSRLSAVLASLDPQKIAPGPDARVQVMEVPGLDVSSSMIRERLAAGLPVRYLVPESVCQLIEKSGVYSPAART